MRFHRRRAKTQRKGAVLVEFAITAPILFLLFFGMVEFARFNFIRHGIDTAVYEGARKGIVPGATVDDVNTGVNEILQAAYVSSSTITVVPSAITPQTDQVTVTINVPLHSNGWVIPFFFSQTTLTRSCTLAREEMDSF